MASAMDGKIKTITSSCILIGFPLQFSPLIVRCGNEVNALIPRIEGAAPTGDQP
jgi:hypothetical protein